MKKHSNSPFRNSELDRARPAKRHIFHTLLYDKNKPKRHRTDTGLVEDSTGSTTIVRIIVGLLLVHLIVIGGVLLRGHMVKGSAGVTVAPSITPPPAAEKATPAPAEEVLPQPAAAPAVAKPAPMANHITQAPADEIAVDPVEPTPVAVVPAPAVPEPAPVAVITPEPAPAAPAAAPVKTVMVKHFVSTGDTWYGIAKQYDTTEAELKAANPKSAAKGTLFSGTNLNVPVKADSPQGQSVAAAAAAQEADDAAKTYVVKKGETLGGIARRNKISLKKLYQLNNLTDKDARRIAPGMKLRISE